MDKRAIVARAFDEWAAGTGYVSSLFADDMTWEIVGHSEASRKYADAADFVSAGGGTPLFKSGTRQVYRQREVRTSRNAVDLTCERV